MGLFLKSLLFVFLLCDMTSANPLSTAGEQATPETDINSTKAADGNRLINLDVHPGIRLIKFNNSYKACDPSNSDWMSTVPDDQPISMMSIPGTHDSCSLHGGNMAKCQTMSLPDQLNSGIRFLDIRCRVINGIFAIHHGIIYQKINFDQVLDQCTDFLTAHPSETILMRIKQEYSSVSSLEFIQIFQKYQAGRESQMYTGDDMNINLGRVRGKIVILADVSGLDGIPWDSLDIQDDYDVKTLADCDKKFNEVKAQLEKAVSQHNTGSMQLFIDFASGASTGAYPNAVANRVNPKLYQYLNGNECIGGCYYGIVPMDFPGIFDKGITDLLIKQNKRKQGC